MKCLFALPLLLLAACNTLDSVGKNAGITCANVPGWNGSPVNILYVNVDKGVAGTAGGNVTVDCGAAGKASVTDSGRLPPAPTRTTP